MFPRKLDILGFEWDVMLDDSNTRAHGNYGHCRFHDFRIEIDSQHPPQRLVEVLLHEVIHAVNDTIFGEEDSINERQLRAISVGLFQVLRDNPCFREMFANCSEIGAKSADTRNRRAENAKHLEAQYATGGPT